MSDHDRGAYTPQTDEPLAFDPRTPSERRPVPMTLIASALVLVLLIAGVALVYRGGVRGAGEAPRPVGQPIMSVKTAPAPEAQPVAPKSDTALDAVSKPAPTVAANNDQTGPAPNFAATAEQPAPRPKPQPKTIASIEPPAKPVVAKPPTLATTSTRQTVTTASSTSAPSGPFSTTPPSGGLDAAEVAAAGMTSRASDRTAPLKLAQASPAKSRRAVVAATEEDDTEEAAPKPAILARPATVAAKSELAGKSGPAVVQIGAFSSSALADKGYSDVSANMSGQMSGKSKHVTPIDKDGKTLFRTWVAGFGSRSEAVSFCEALRAKNKTCIVKS